MIYIRRKFLLFEFLICITFFIFNRQNCFCHNTKFDMDYLNGDYDFNLPSEYSSTSQSLVTDVKIQGHSGPCWSFGIISALETGLIKQDNLKTKIDFSEMNLIYNLNSGASLNNPYEFNFTSSGNNEMASAYFASGRGPVLEKDDPYKSDYVVRDYSENLKKPLNKYVRQIIYIPDTDKFDSISLRNHRELVKKFIMENGSVASNIFWDEKYLDVSQKNYFYNSYSQSTNHTVAIVGWNDNYPKENFNLENMPENNGAFIVKNSWGKDKHDNGFFYMSYEDKFAGFNAYVLRDIVDAQDKYKFQNIYQHDYFGMTGAIEQSSLGDKKNICSVFDLKSEQEALSDIGVFIASNDVDCKFFLVNVTDDNKIVGYSDYIYETNFEFPGYYVIELPDKILLDNKKFGIAVNMSAQNLFIPCEQKDYSFNSKAVGMPNQNFFGNEYGFDDIYRKFNNVTNFCIKGFTEKNLNGARQISFHKFKSLPNPTSQIKRNLSQPYEYKHTRIKSFGGFDKFVLIIVLLPFVGVIFSYFLSKNK